MTATIALSPPEQRDYWLGRATRLREEIRIAAGRMHGLQSKIYDLRYTWEPVTQRLATTLDAYVSCGQELQRLIPDYLEAERQIADLSPTPTPPGAGGQA